ncbi:glycoside hydrolase family 43 protein [Porphyromonadaceae sp. NP-X]|nr:glycoside hydrolase family 43 protein [Porphyromonadaceae sp. NP-X]
MKRLFLSLYFVFFVLHFALGQQKLPLADPFILCYENKYYAYGTSDPDGIVVYTSDDLKFWTKQSNLALHKNNSYADRWFWAPEVYFINGQFYMYYSADEHICVATSSSPLGPFVQDIQQPMFEEKGIDNSLFIDDDGTPYLFFVRFTDGNAIWMAELEKDYKTIKTNTLHLCFAANTSGWEADMGKVNEGPFCIKHNGLYYLTYSANDYRSQKYGVGYAYTDNISGGWVKNPNNPILQKPDGLYGTGHHCLFTDKDGQLRMAFHAHHSETEVNPREMYTTSVEFVPGNRRDVLTVGPGYQPAFIKPVGMGFKTIQNTEKAKISVESRQVVITGYEINTVSLYDTNGCLIACKNNAPFSFLMKKLGCYVVAIQYKNNQSETLKLII